MPSLYRPSTDGLIQVCVSVFVGVFVLWEGVQEMHGCCSEYIQMCTFVQHL